MIDWFSLGYFRLLVTHSLFGFLLNRLSLYLLLFLLFLCHACCGLCPLLSTECPFIFIFVVDDDTTLRVDYCTPDLLLMLLS